MKYFGTIRVFVRQVSFRRGYRPGCLCAAMLLLAPMPAAAQVPANLQFPPGPVLAGTGGAGSAWTAHGAALQLNPAVLAARSGGFVDMAGFSISATEQRGIILLAGASVGPFPVAVQIQQKWFDDLFEDAGIDPGELRVADGVVKIATGLSVGSRAAFGISVARQRSDVLLTRGSATLVDVGMILRLREDVSVGLAARRLGSGVTWITGDDEPVRSRTGSVPAARIGVAASRSLDERFTVTVLGDAEWGPDMDRSDFGAGIQVDVAAIAQLRGGVSRTGAPSLSPTGGLGVRTGGIWIDLGYESRPVIGSVVHVGLRLGA